MSTNHVNALATNVTEMPRLSQMCYNFALDAQAALPTIAILGHKACRSTNGIILKVVSGQHTQCVCWCHHHSETATKTEGVTIEQIS